MAFSNGFVLSIHIAYIVSTIQLAKNGIDRVRIDMSSDFNRSSRDKLLAVNYTGYYRRWFGCR